MNNELARMQKGVTAALCQHSDGGPRNTQPPGRCLDPGCKTSRTESRIFPQLSGDNLKKTHVLPSRSNLFVTEQTAKFGGVVSWQRVEFTATSPSPRARNVWIIRSLGRDDEILRECFDRRREQVEWGSTFCSLHEHTAAPSGEHTVPK